MEYSTHVSKSWMLYKESKKIRERKMTPPIGVNQNQDIQIPLRPKNDGRPGATNTNSGSGIMTPWSSNSGYSNSFNYGSAWNSYANHTGNNTGSGNVGQPDGNNDGGMSTEEAVNMAADITVSLVEILTGTIGNKEKGSAEDVEKKEDTVAKETETTIKNGDDKIKANFSEVQSIISDGITTIATLGDDNEAQMGIITDAQEMITEITDAIASESEAAQSDVEQLNSMGISDVSVAEIPTSEAPPQGGDGIDSPVSDDGSGNVGSNPSPTNNDGSGSGGSQINPNAGEANLAKQEALLADLNKRNENITALGGQYSELGQSIANAIAQITSNIEGIQSQQTSMQGTVQTAQNTTMQVAQTVRTSTNKQTTQMTRSATQQGVKGGINVTTSATAKAGQIAFQAAADAARSSVFGSGAASELERKAQVCGEQSDLTGNSDGAAYINFQNVAEITTKVINLVEKIASGEANWQSLSSDINGLMGDAASIAQDAISRGGINTGQDDGGNLSGLQGNQGNQGGQSNPGVTDPNKRQQA